MLRHSGNTSRITHGQDDPAEMDGLHFLPEDVLPDILLPFWYSLHVCQVSEKVSLFPEGEGMH